MTPDGREWTYVKVSTGGIQKGGVGVPTANTAVDNVSSSTDAMGRIVYITKASAGWTNGQFTNGWVVIDDGTGVGQTAKIIGNTTDTLQLAPENALTTALAVADSDITISQPFLVVKSLVTTKVQNAVGIAQFAASAGDYIWLLTKGIGTVIAGIAITIAVDFVTGDDTAGQVTIGTTGKGPFDEQYLGRSLVTNAAADQLVLVYVDIA